LSISDFAVLVLAATDSARSVHAVRVETDHGLVTEMTGDTLFGRVDVIDSRWGECVQVKRPATRQILRVPETSATET
jgi:hypothetical protein